MKLRPVKIVRAVLSLDETARTDTKTTYKGGKMKFEVFFFEQMNGKYRSLEFDFLDEAQRFAKSCRSWALPSKQPYIIRKGV